MYGGKQRADDKAIKAAAHDLKAAVQIFNTNTADLQTPLMCIVDYRGYRLLCSSKVPLGSNTMKLGSNDGGRTLKDDCAELRNKVKNVCRVLNLKKHIVLPTQRGVWGPGDLEGHVGLDGKHYVVDLARLFPPEAPSPDETRAVYYNMLRPELVKNNPVPLSSDALTGWCSKDTIDGRRNNEEVKACSMRLHTEVIPALAAAFDRESTPEASWDFSLEFHSHGVNMRHLGRVKELVTQAKASTDLLFEMVVRVFKNELRQQLRDKMEEIKVASEEPYRLLVVNFLNTIMQHSLADEAVDRPFEWLAYIGVLVWKKFKYTLTEADNADLLAAQSAERVLARVAEKMGITLSSSVQQAILVRNQGIIISTQDLEHMTATAKSMSILGLAEGMMQYYEVQILMKQKRAQQFGPAGAGGVLGMLKKANMLLSRAMSLGHTETHILLARANIEAWLADRYIQYLPVDAVLSAAHRKQAMSIYESLTQSNNCAAQVHFDYSRVINCVTNAQHEAAKPNVTVQCTIGLRKDPSTLDRLLNEVNAKIFQSREDIGKAQVHLQWMKLVAAAAAVLWPQNPSAHLLFVLATIRLLRTTALPQNLDKELGNSLEVVLESDEHALDKYVELCLHQYRYYTPQYFILPGLLAFFATFSPSLQKVLARYFTGIKHINMPYFNIGLSISVTAYGNQHRGFQAQIVDMCPQLRELSYHVPIQVPPPPPAPGTVKPPPPPPPHGAPAPAPAPQQPRTLRNVSRLCDPVFAAIAEHCPHFSRLVRCQNPINWDRQNVHLVKSLTHIDLIYADDTILTSMANMSWLQRLSLTAPQVDGQQLPALVKAILANNADTLTHVSLIDMCISDDVTETIGRACEMVEQLWLENITGASDGGLGAMFAAIDGRQSGGKLRKLRMKGFVDGWTNSWLAVLPRSLEHIWLESVGPGLHNQQEAKGLLAAMQHMPALTRLSLCNVPINSMVCNEMLGVVAPRLTRLYVVGCGHLTSKAFESISGFPALTHLHLSAQVHLWNDVLADKLERSSALKHFALEWQPTTARPSRPNRDRFAFLSKCQSLKTVSILTFSGVTKAMRSDDDLRQIINNLPPSVKHLRMSCFGSDPLLVKLLVSKCPKLKTFFLSNSAIGNSALKYLSQAKRLQNFMLYRLGGADVLSYSGLCLLRSCPLAVLMADYYYVDLSVLAPHFPNTTMLPGMPTLFRSANPPVTGFPAPPDVLDALTRFHLPGHWIAPPEAALLNPEQHHTLF
eukprot:TRINITY_DN2996_c0_g1_i1.p1 TRINITY_DN2996_c0_g1~~TRINITY_DN2996_c0_g1_i1.p1  ORF type:complete len:1244 (-),score=201.79 TRINITY_DN2996_c0_g1_i1:41-3772(-)